MPKRNKRRKAKSGKSLSNTQLFAPITILPRELKGRVAIVTGSTSGIGLAIAHALAAKGADIVMNGLPDPKKRKTSLKDIEKLRADLAAEHGVRVIFDAADMSKPDQLELLVHRAVKELGSVDILVNNAGTQHVCPIDEFPIREIKRVIDVNLVAPIILTSLVTPHMKKRRWGRIINIASAHATVGSPNKVSYCSSKAGLIGKTKSAGVELANTGITVNCINPGWVLTPLIEDQIKKKMKEFKCDREQAKLKLLARQPMKQFTMPDDIAAMAAVLCSHAGRTITGTYIGHDGGYAAG
jgi:3-hydroxybutyrate dehydrogenase